MENAAEIARLTVQAKLLHSTSNTSSRNVSDLSCLGVNLQLSLSSSPTSSPKQTSEFSGLSMQLTRQWRHARKDGQSMGHQDQGSGENRPREGWDNHPFLHASAMGRRERSHLVIPEDWAARERRDGVPGASRKARAGDPQIPEWQSRREGV